jgi:hypothetical protein
VVSALTWLMRMTVGAYLLAAVGGCADAERNGGALHGPVGGAADAAMNAPMGGAGAQSAGSVATDASSAGARPDASAGSPSDGATSAGNDAAAGHRDGGDAGDTGDAGDAGARPVLPAQRDSRPLAGPPSYLGSVDNSAECSRSYPTVGFEPIAEPGERFPLFLYFVGTAFVPDPSGTHEDPAALAVAEAMARRGFVALSVGYDNGAVAWLSDHEAQLACLFAKDSPSSVLSVACALPQVDCDQGIATWGHSQGALVGVLAARIDDRVRAAWATGYGGDGRTTLSRNRLRVVNGEADFNNGTADTLNAITGLTPAECPAGASTCLRADGSGWIIVRKAELADPASSSADHCWFAKRACLDSTVVLEPSWTDRASTRPYALELNADWLARTARTP